MLTVELRGIDALQRRLARLGTEAPRAVAAGLLEEAETIATRSAELVPVDTGTLRSSQHVTPPETRGGVTEVQIAYGGPAAPYALAVHEDLTARHPVGQAKYLEQPATEALRGMVERLGAHVERVAQG